jgi:hypothetical protein
MGTRRWRGEEDQVHCILSVRWSSIAGYRQGRFFWYSSLTWVVQKKECTLHITLNFLCNKESWVSHVEYPSWNTEAMVVLYGCLGNISLEYFSLGWDTDAHRDVYSGFQWETYHPIFMVQTLHYIHFSYNEICCIFCMIFIATWVFVTLW